MNIKSNHLNCLPGKFLSGVYQLLNKIREKSLFIQTLSKEDPGQRPAGMTSSFGFTLIELLVVVLIIGILSAIALPQYQKAVLKSRLMSVAIMMKAIKLANNTYYLANGEYTSDPEKLDVSFPAGYTIDNPEAAEATVVLPNGDRFTLIKAKIEGAAYPRIMGWCRNCPAALWLAYDTDKWMCYPLSTDAGAQLCRSFGATNCQKTDNSCNFSF